MLKTLTAIGISAAIAFAPLAAFAQTDTTRLRGRRSRRHRQDGAGQGLDEEDEAQEAHGQEGEENGEEGRQPLPPKRRRAKPPGSYKSTSKESRPIRHGWGGFFFVPRAFAFASGARVKLAHSSRKRDGERRVLVRVREHLFLSGGAPRRRARRSSGACALSGARSCSGRSSPRRAGATRRSTSIPPRAATCGATLSGRAPRWAFRSSGPSLFHSRACSLRELRSRSRARSVPTSRAASSSPNSVEGMRDRRSRDARRLAGCMRRRSGDGARAGRKRGQQGAAQGRMRPRSRDRRHRRALSRDRGRRSLLGQRPA